MSCIASKWPAKSPGQLSDFHIWILFFQPYSQGSCRMIQLQIICLNKAVATANLISFSTDSIKMAYNSIPVLNSVLKGSFFSYPEYQIEILTSVQVFSPKDWRYGANALCLRSQGQHKLHCWALSLHIKHHFTRKFTQPSLGWNAA